MGKGGSVLRELKPVLRRIGLYYLLLAVNIFPCASLIPDRFPTRNLSTIYLLLLSVCLVLYYAHRVPPRSSFAPTMQLLSWMGLLLILLRGVKYSAFAEVGVLARHTWYLYYVPMLLLPLFLFRIALLVTPKERGWEARAWYPALGLTLALILLVLSNDLHQQVFAFRLDFFDWDRSHSHGWLFYVVTLWQYALYLAAVLILVSKCRIGGSRRSARILLIPFAVGAALNVLLFTGTMPKLNGSHLVEFPEALICSAATVLECCMQLGLIPTNQDYGKLFHLLSISAQITDSRGRTVYASRTALPLTREQFAMEDNTRIGEHKVLRRMPLPGGFGFWQDDLTELDRLNEALAEAKDALTQESELIRLRGALKERQAKIEQRTRVYDAIAKRTRRQAQSISWLARARRIQVDSFWYKDGHKDSLLEVMERTMAGERVYPDETPLVRLGCATNHDLTERELDVLKELSTGDTNAEIAERLGVSVATVKSHILHMMEKTGFKTRTELVSEARGLGIVVKNL